MRRTMSLCLSGVLTVWMAQAAAHAHLRSAVPADGSVVAVAPARIELHFSEAARLTAAWIEKDGGAKQRLSSLPHDSAAKLDLPLPQLAPGRYEVSWRVLSADGHVVPGRLRFTFSPSVSGAR